MYISNHYMVNTSYEFKIAEMIYKVHIIWEELQVYQTK